MRFHRAPEPALVIFLLTVWFLVGGDFALAQQEPSSLQPELVPSDVTATAPAPVRRELTLEERGDLALARKSFRDAVDYYRRAIRENGDKEAGLWNKLGIAHQQVLDYKQARKAYERAAKLDRQFAEPWNNLGTTYFLDNKTKKSIKYYRRALQINSSNASFHLNLGTALYHRKKYAEAIDSYRTALEIDPRILSDRSTVGTVMQTRGADARFYFYMAKVFASLGRAEEAVRFLRRALEDGFKDFKRIDADPDLQKISEFPDYVQLRANPPIPIRD
jgi:tetratricopeptide (TPR) repeat protein